MDSAISPERHSASAERVSNQCDTKRLVSLLVIRAKTAEHSMRMSVDLPAQGREL